MRISQLFTKTTKNVPADEVSKNAQLLIRAGFVYKVMAGVYAYTPLGLKVLDKIKQIVREEMNAIGGQEIIMSSLQKKETWEATGRWDDQVVDVWFKTKLKDDTELGLGWSHEEAIIEMMKQYIKSYNDLPANVYQFQNKLRNELRAKSGIMRGREFIMKDMYSCSTDAEQHEKFYQETITAYKKVYDRLGIGEDTYVTFASGGAFTKFSHEFQTVCDAGEDVIYRVPSTNETFNEEIAPSMAPKSVQNEEAEQEIQIITHKDKGAEKIAKAFNIPVEKTTKTMLYVDEKDQVIVAVVRGDYEINEDKLKSVASVEGLKLASEEMIKDVTGAEVGFAGLIDLPKDIKVIVDDSCKDLKNFEIGINQTNKHALNANWGRDLAEPKEYFDIKTAKRGDLHPETGEVYEVLKTAEVGNIFNFGTQKSKEMDFAFTNKEGKKQFIHLGSYGIGITRVMGVLVEKFADEKGMVWPEAVAPAQVYLVRLGESKEVIDYADKIYTNLQDKGVEVIYDDRDARAGEKFADADLLGIPHRVVISQKTIEKDALEYKKRTSSENSLISFENLLQSLLN